MGGTLEGKASHGGLARTHSPALVALSDTKDSHRCPASETPFRHLLHPLLLRTMYNMLLEKWYHSGCTATLLYSYQYVLLVLER